MLETQDFYDAAGWLQDVIDPRGIDYRTLYDGMGRIVESIDDYTNGVPTTSSNYTTAYTYDGDNHRLTVTAVQPAGTPSQTTQYVYGVTTTGGSAINSNDLLATTEYPDPTTGLPSSSPSQQTTYTYNAIGQMTGLTDRNGTTHQFTYDVLGRQTSDAVTTLGSNVDGSIRRIDTAYDSQGNPYLYTSYADPAGTTIVNQVEDVYNGLSQLTSEYQSPSGPVVVGTTPVVQYTYTDLAGGQNNSRLTSMTYPNGRVVTYNYDAGLDNDISRLSSISDNTGVLEAYTYLGLDTVVERAHPQTNVNLTYISPTGATGDAGDQYTGLDRFGRVVEALWYDTSTSSATDDFLYVEDQDGNILSKNNVLNSALNEQYTYDDRNQLTAFTRGSETETWTYDALGNWTSVTVNGVPQARTTNAQNEYQSVAGQTPPAYDNNGNLTADPNGNTYVYDAWDRLVAVKNGSTTLESYSYDAINRRVTQTTGTTVDLFYNSDWQVIEERTAGSSTASTQYVWSPLSSDTLVERDSNPNGSGVLTLRLYAQQDANGNVTALVDTSGTVVERFVYDPYGSVTVLTASWGAGSDTYSWNYLFQGLRYDTTSELYYSRNRDYSPTLGRFLQQDPAGFSAGDDNLYRFEEGQPTFYVDPLGETRTKLPPPQPGGLAAIQPLPRTCNWCQGNEGTFGAARMHATLNCCCSCQQKDFMMYADLESSRKSFAHALKNAGDVFGVRNVEHMINTLRANVGQCQCVNKLTISAHGGFAGQGGFRFSRYDGTPQAGQETISQANAQRFGTILAGIMCRPCVINVMACGSADGQTLATIAAATGCNVRGVQNGNFERRNITFFGIRDLWKAYGAVVDVAPNGQQTVLHPADSTGDEAW